MQKSHWTSDWGVRLHWPRPITCYTATTGESSRPTRTIHKVPCWLKRSGKELPEMLATIRQDRAQGQAIKLMFQDEARFGRIPDVRQCWAPKPLRPICPAMLTHQYANTRIHVCLWRCGCVHR